ncbi:MAG TPA: HAD-IG family 5'-nucleotidase [Gemmatimonadaceae bacterium]|nr:HAD-IG family 5'-nucleotidase [Gemmatimonadaceae bacterium]
MSVGAPVKSGETPAPSTSREPTAAQPLDVPRRNRVYVNRNLRLDKIEMVGFDMDYTLALYNQARIEELSMRATLHKLVTAKGYPTAIQGLAYDPMLAVRGLVVDRINGNIFKPDRYGFPGRARHGLATIDRSKVGELYQRERMRLSNQRYAWIDSLFALPEAVLYACLVDYFDHHDTPGKPDYPTLWEHIRECIDLAHRDGSIKAIVSVELTDYVERDEGLADTLHKFRSSGKRLFLLTNSAWDYTSTVMSYLLDGVRGGYPSWRNYFDIVVVSAAKPEFFTDEHPFVELDAEGAPVGKAAASDSPLQRGRIYSGGNLKEFQTRAQAHGDRVLFVGDHIYGDMLRSRKSSNWRTAMVLQELEHEITMYDRLRPELARLDRLDAELIHLDSELYERQAAMRALQKRSAESNGGDGVSEAKRAVKDAIEKLRRDLRETAAQHRSAEDETDDAFNPYWGPLFREGYEVSKFGEQVEAYACVYTSRVSNFRFYSPMQYFRGPRDRMPHER